MSKSESKSNLKSESESESNQNNDNIICKNCNEICHMYCLNNCGTQTCYKCKTSYFRNNGIHIGHNKLCGN